MARATLNSERLPSQSELASFARAAGRWWVTAAPRPGESRSSRRRRGPGVLFLEHRDYQPGDDIRNINWPLTVKLGRPVLREREAERRADWLVCVDASSSMIAAQGAKWGYAIRLAAGLSYALLELGHRVAALLFSDSVVGACLPGRGSTQYLRISSLLAAAQPLRRGSLTVLGSGLPRLAGLSSAIVLSDFLTADAARGGLEGFAARCADTHAIQIGDRRELDLPPARTLELTDVETGARTTWTRDRAAARRIENSQAERTRDLARACAVLRVRFSSCDVATPWQQTLLRHLAGESRR